MVKGKRRNLFWLEVCIESVFVYWRVPEGVCIHRTLEPQIQEGSVTQRQWGTRSSVETGADLVLLQMSVQLPVIVMQQTRQLIHLNLRKKEEKNSYWQYQSEEYKNAWQNNAII